VAQDDGDAVQQPSLQELESAIALGRLRSERLSAKQAALARENEALTQELVEVGAKAQELEAELGDVEATLAALAEEIADRQRDLGGAREEYGRLLNALVRLSLMPPEAVLASPGSPIDGARAGTLLSQLTPALREKADSLRGDLNDLRGLEQQIEAENAEALAAKRALENERAHLGELIERRRRLLALTEQEKEAARKETQLLEQEVKDLQGLVEASTRLSPGSGPPEVPPVAPKRAGVVLFSERNPTGSLSAEDLAVAPASEDDSGSKSRERQQVASLAPGAGAGLSLRSFPHDPLTLSKPVSGRLSAGFGTEALAPSGRSKGLVVRTRPGSPVVAPFDGRVVYAGAFRSYGQVLILDHGRRYHSVLAGLGEIDVALGQAVVEGEPIGTMVGPGSAPPELYLELRRDGRPINPDPWFDFSR